MASGYSVETFYYKNNFINDNINKDLGNLSVIIISETTNNEFSYYMTLILNGETFNLISYSKNVYYI